MNKTPAQTAAPLPPFEMALYGRKIGAEDWQEELLTTNPARFDEVKRLAAADGFGHFRTARINLTTPPDFAGTINGTVRRKARR